MYSLIYLHMPSLAPCHAMPCIIMIYQSNIYPHANTPHLHTSLPLTRLPTYPPTYPHSYLHTPTYLSTPIHTHLPTLTPTHLHTYPPSHPPTHPPTLTPTHPHPYLLTHLPTYSSTLTHTYLPTNPHTYPHPRAGAIGRLAAHHRHGAASKQSHQVR